MNRPFHARTISIRFCYLLREKFLHEFCFHLCLTELTVPVYEDIEIVFEETTGITCLAGQTVTIGYTLYGGDSRTMVECITDNGWKASVNPFNIQSGEIKVIVDIVTDVNYVKAYKAEY